MYPECVFFSYCSFLVHISPYFLQKYIFGPTLKINEDMVVVVGSVALVAGKLLSENSNFAFGSKLEMCHGGSFLGKTRCTFLPCSILGRKSI